jgi:hypothetical protein
MSEFIASPDAARENPVPSNERATVRAALRTHGVVTVTAEYEGSGGSGQFEDCQYLDSRGYPMISVDADVLQPLVEGVFLALLDERHGGWRDNHGAFGGFAWNLTMDYIGHQHSRRFIEIVDYCYDEAEQAREAEREWEL